MKTVDAYKEKQKLTTILLHDLLDYVKESEKFGITIDPQIINKIETTIRKNNQTKLMISLIGGFSEGKTTIVAAWSEHYDKFKMKISQVESTDEVSIYECDDDYVLVDTPGLFGFKETVAKTKYKDITKKYVSQSDIVLYVMSHDNPIKESHKDELIWLFKELDLLPRTVFVLSRFDNSVDIEDEEEYLDVLSMRKEFIIQRLNDFGIIKDYIPPIVAVAADPYAEGLDYWLDHTEEYKKISHIKDLQDATFDIINKQGGRDTINLKSQHSVIKDILFQSLPVAEDSIKQTNQEINLLNKEYQRIDKELNKLERTIIKDTNNLKEFIINFFTDLIIELKSTSLESFDLFFEQNIGDEGYRIDEKIKIEFSSTVGKINNEISNVQNITDTSINHYNTVLRNAAIEGIKQGNKFLKEKAKNINNQAILKIRDFVLPKFKFKPWQAVKMAKNVANGLAAFCAFINIALDVWEKYNEIQRNAELEKAKKNNI